MQLAGTALALIAVTVAQCSDVVIDDGSDPSPSSISDYATHQPYGVDGSLSPDEAAWLEGLAYPQTYDAMKGTFGFPAYRSTNSDIYQVEGGGQIEVFYDSNGLAVGYERK